MLDPRDERPAERERLRDWLALAEALCLSPVRALECLEASGGDPVRALACSGSRSRASSGQLEAALETLKAREVRVVPITSRTYPAPLRALPDPPPVLFLLGEMPDWSRPTVAIVGARAATRYGLAVAERLAHELALAGVVVVSGLARGVDGAAHRGALRGGTTWAVLGCGIDIHYPAEHRNLSQQITHSGAVLSELPPGRPPAAPHFPLRNRIISGLVQTVVVVEARARSGSLITARHALGQGRDVMVVPGSIDSPTSEGSNALLRDGAQPVLEPDDVLRNLAGAFALGALHQKPPASHSERTPSDPESARLIEALARGPLQRHELQESLGLSVSEISLRLVELEIEGWLCQDRDGRFLITPARALESRPAPQPEASMTAEVHDNSRQRT